MDPRTSQLNTNDEERLRNASTMQPQIEEEQDPTDIASDIQTTRAHMSETIDAIQERLAPERLIADAKESVKIATVKKVQDMTDTVRSSAQGAGNSLMATIRQNPIPALMAGVGLGWLWYRSRSASAQPVGQPRYVPQQTANFAYGTANLNGMNNGITQETPNLADRAGQVASDARDRVGDLAGTVQERAGDLSDQVQQQAGHTKDALQTAWGQHPLTFGAVAVALGAAAGMLLPETAPEQRLMGSARDMVVQHAQDAVQETTQKVQHVAQRTLDTVQDEAQKQGLTKK